MREQRASGRTALSIACCWPLATRITGVLLAALFCSAWIKARTYSEFMASGRAYKPDAYAFRVCVGDELCTSSETYFSRGKGKNVWIGGLRNHRA